jgi:cytochrome b561
MGSPGRATTSPGRYGGIARTLHWLMAVLIIVTIAIMELHGYAARGSALRAGISSAHYQIGVAVFFLVWLRLLRRIRDTAPPITPAPPAWQQAISHVVAWLFYALMVVLPLLGVTSVQANGRPVPFLGMTLPPFIAADRDLGHKLEDVHVWLGNVMIGLIALHVLAVLYHRFVLHDDALARMLGGRPSSSPVERA